MKKRMKVLIAIGLTFVMALGSCVTTWADAADAASAGADIGDMSFVVVNGEAEETLCAEHIVIETYDDLLEYHSATKRVDNENWKYAPDSYDREDRPFVSNCVILRVYPDTSLTIDAEHIVTIIQNTDSNSFYIQCDSEEAAEDIVEALNEVDEIMYAGKNAYGVFGIEDETEPKKSPYTDVSETDWFYTAVAALYDEETMMGPKPGEFGPYEKFARAQFAVVLYRTEEEPDVDYDAIFPDVAEEQFYTEAVLWTAQNNIVTGYGNGMFGPADNITREQLAVMLYRYAQYKGYDISGTADYSTFVDADAMQPFSKEGMNWAVAKGIIQGKDLDGDQVAETLEPQGTTSRAEAAVMFYRFLEMYAE